VVRVKEYPRWSHNQQHRRGAQYRVNGQRIVRSISGDSKSKIYHQIDKQRVLNVNSYANKQSKNTAKRFKQALSKQQSVDHTKTLRPNKQSSNKQRGLIQKQAQKQAQSESQHRQKLSNHYRPNKTDRADTPKMNTGKSQKTPSLEVQNNKVRHFTANTQDKTRTYTPKNNSSNKSRDYRASSHKQNKSRPIKVTRQNKLKQK
jgi:hypothetical protein